MRTLFLLFVALLLVAGCYSSVKQLEDPVVLPQSGEYNVSALEITMQSSSSSAIYYTMDGSGPDEGTLKYEKPFTITESKVIKAVAIKEGLILPSNIVTRTYVLTK